MIKNEEITEEIKISEYENFLQSVIQMVDSNQVLKINKEI